MKTLWITSLSLAAALVATPVFAGHKGGDYATTDYAKVTRVKPIYETVEVIRPREECYQERVVAYDRHSGEYRSHTGTLLGAIIGGAIGNELGHHKSNKRVGAVVGAAMGASIARDIGHRNRDHTSGKRYRTVEQCHTVDDVDYREEVVGYWVNYRYHGDTYTTRMPYDPGKRLKVRVSVEPIE